MSVSSAANYWMGMWADMVVKKLLFEKTQAATAQACPYYYTHTNTQQRKPPKTHMHSHAVNASVTFIPRFKLRNQEGDKKKKIERERQHRELTADSWALGN